MKTCACIRCSITALWLASIAWLVRFEAFPGWFTRTFEGYRSLIAPGLLVKDSWARIMFKDSPVGWSHTTVDVNEASPARYYELKSSLFLKLNIMDETQTIDVDSEAFLDVLHQLQKFTFKLSSRAYSLRIQGVRCGKDKFDVAMHTGGRTVRSKLDLPNDTVLYSPMTEMSLRKLKPGQHLSIRTLEPISMTAIPIQIKALRREPVAHGGTTNQATVLAVEYQGRTFLSWINDEGDVLRQETPFGWRLEKCTPSEALACVDAPAPGEDILSGMAVRCRGVIADPKNAKLLKLRLKGVPFKPGELVSPRQSVVQEDDSNVVLTVSAGKRLPGGSGPQTDAPDAAEFLKPSPWIQSDDPDMISQAARIAGAGRTRSEKALLIMNWVHDNVRKRPTVSIPSALEVLRRLEGDCNEHAYLFTALAKSAGVPAQVVVGLAYHEGKFFYHAWTKVHAGEWIEMDPTWNQAAVDATHIAVVSGDIADQLGLVRLIGQLEIEVMEQQ